MAFPVMGLGQNPFATTGMGALPSMAVDTSFAGVMPPGMASSMPGMAGLGGMASGLAGMGGMAGMAGGMPGMGGMAGMPGMGGLFGQDQMGMQGQGQMMTQMLQLLQILMMILGGMGQQGQQQQANQGGQNAGGVPNCGGAQQAPQQQQCAPPPQQNNCAPPQQNHCAPPQQNHCAPPSQNHCGPRPGRGRRPHHCSPHGGPRESGGAHRQGGVQNREQLEGKQGGQCVPFVERQVGHYFPVTEAKQMLDDGKHDGYDVEQSPQAGDIFVQKGGQYGHTGIVDSVNKDGSLTVTDSNWNLDEKIHTHSMDAGTIDGYLRQQQQK